MTKKEILNFFIDNVKNWIWRAQLKDWETVYAKKVWNNIFEIKRNPITHQSIQVSKLVLSPST